MLKANVVKKNYAFPIRRPDGTVGVVSQRAESRAAALLLLKERIDAGEFIVIEEVDHAQ